jgi:tetratricopeptide (TPR) repeat protein
MKKALIVASLTLVTLVCMILSTLWDRREAAYAGKTGETDARSAGSENCRACHETFCSNWFTSPHGRAIRSYSGEDDLAGFVRQGRDITVGKAGYRIDLGLKDAYVTQSGAFPWETARYRIEHVVEGKDLKFFLTPFERGRPQVLPVAYDVRKKEWFYTLEHGIIHSGAMPADWKEPANGFDTVCYGCHVSQVSSHYDLKTNRYRPLPADPGIACDSCHGQVERHAEHFSRAGLKKGESGDLRIISLKNFTPDKINDVCASCHAGMVRITERFVPGDNLYDHFAPAKGEQTVSPSGGMTGRGHAFARWRASPCVKTGKLDCLHCHTLGGEKRFGGRSTADSACMPCHEKQVRDAGSHTHHKPGGSAPACISCHMPTYLQGRMRQTDHSMLPPAPAASLVDKSLNACTLCHSDRDASWADKAVRQWFKDDYQAGQVKAAVLLEAARKRDWSRLPDMLAYIEAQGHDEVVTASLLRFLKASRGKARVQVFIKALADPSPIVRAAAAEALEGVAGTRARKALLGAAADPVRMVRIRAASALAKLPEQKMPEGDARSFSRATGEYIVSMVAYQDRWTSQNSLGDYLAGRGDYTSALMAYEAASNLDPGAVLPYVNASKAYMNLGNLSRAEAILSKAFQIDPDSAPAHLARGLLEQKQGNGAEAERDFRLAFKKEPSQAEAAYDLSLILAKNRIKDAVAWAKKAYQIRPVSQYGYTLATFMKQDGDWDGAVDILKQVIAADETYGEAYLLQGEILEMRGKKRDAAALYRQGLAVEEIPENDRYRLEIRLESVTKG